MRQVAFFLKFFKNYAKSFDILFKVWNNEDVGTKSHKRLVAVLQSPCVGLCDQYKGYNLIQGF